MYLDLLGQMFWDI